VTKDTFVFPDAYGVDAEFSIDFMIDVLAEGHGQSKRVIENEYTMYDYYLYVTRKNLDGAKDKYKMKNDKS
jgi:hypothetical protein